MRLIERILGAVLLCALPAGFVACGGSSNSGGSGSSSDSSSSGTGSDGSSDGSGGSGGDGSSSSSNGSGGDSSSSSSSGNGGDTSGNGSSNTSVGLVMGDPIPIEDYGTAVSEAFCPSVTPCCSENFGLTVSDADCVGVLALLFGEDYQSADPANYSYDPDLAGDCVATAERVYQSLDCNFDASQNPGVDAMVSEVCDSVFTGKLEPGAACNSDIECAAGPGEDASCDDPNLDGNMICVVQYRATLGEDCYWTCSEDGLTTSCSGSGTNDSPELRGECYTSDGLFCGSEGVCEELAALGEACTSDQNCVRGFCDSGECTAPVGEGEDCVSDSWCSDGLYCESSVCTSKLADGQSCTFSSECQSGLCESDSCAGEGDASDFGLALICGVIAGQL